MCNKLQLLEKSNQMMLLNKVATKQNNTQISEIDCQPTVKDKIQGERQQIVV